MQLANYASQGIIYPFYKGCIMASREYTKRVDIKDEVGNKYNDLTVISYAGKGKFRGALWLCQCICGNQCIVPGGHLRANMRQSCGCRSQRRITQTGINRVFSTYKRKALLRNIIFHLSREEVGNIILNDCYYCGREPFNELKRLKTKKIQIYYSGMDRVDPSKGYTIENCVPCCYYCNHAKLDLSMAQFVDHITTLYHHLKKRI